ncbi:MAG: hypothetical protein A2511_00475 [Deltaproteobacteria bacterium RIFOXYD12_FULL_50_9]|nr:MAG: hypothetical protein A2511_00475 [Deltaproteobacteria bacterium RIFOXYD12_FULL_50_9]
MNNDLERRALATERRLHPRFSARERALVTLNGNDLGMPYHMIDISEGGMSFRYLNENPLSLTDQKMDLYLEDELYVGRLPVIVIDDRQVGDEFIPKRRCCVRFGKLSQAQQLQLQTFILCHTKSTQLTS